MQIPEEIGRRAEKGKESELEDLRSVQGERLLRFY